MEIGLGDDIMPNGSYGMLANGQRVDLQARPAATYGEMAGGQQFQMNTGPGQMDPSAYLDNAMKSQIDSARSRTWFRRALST